MNNTSNTFSVKYTRNKCSDVFNLPKDLFNQEVPKQLFSPKELGLNYCSKDKDITAKHYDIYSALGKPQIDQVTPKMTKTSHNKTNESCHYPDSSFYMDSEYRHKKHHRPKNRHVYSTCQINMQEVLKEEKPKVYKRMRSAYRPLEDDIKKVRDVYSSVSEYDS